CVVVMPSHCLSSARAGSGTVAGVTIARFMRGLRCSWDGDQVMPAPGKGAAARARRAGQRLDARPAPGTTASVRDLEQLDRVAVENLTAQPLGGVEVHEGLVGERVAQDR